MGYKLAGFDVIGCNEIDPRMNKVYVANHHPRSTFWTVHRLAHRLAWQVFTEDVKRDGAKRRSSERGR